MLADQITLAYLAGIIDADGYITINRSQRGKYVYHAPQIGIAGTRREPHDLAAGIWGGKVGFYQPDNGHRGQYQWSRQGAMAAQIIETLHPYLRVKLDQAVLALELWQHTEDGRATKDDPFPWFGPQYDPITVRDAMREEMIGLNQSRTRVGKRAAGRLLDGREWNEVPA